MSDHCSIAGAVQTRPVTKAPPLACDCHTHVFGPAERFPYWPGRSYTPGDASIADLIALHSILGMQRVVIVQPSVYGTDNRCTVNAIQQLGARARGVAVIDPAATLGVLRTLHEAGIRGVRLNLQTAGQNDPAQAWEMLRTTAHQVAPLGWHVQVYTELALIAALSERLITLPTTLVIDHFGLAKAAAGVQQAGFDRLLALLGTGRVYLKLSAPYRMSDVPGYADVTPIARALIAANPERLVWGTDWPHPGTHAASARPLQEIEPFRPEDDGAALDRVAGWCGNEGTLRRVLVDNPAGLYDFNKEETP